MGDPKGFTSGNYFPWNQAWIDDNFLAIEYTNSGNYISTTREELSIAGRIVFGDDKPVTHSAEEAYEMVLQYAGASLSRDSVDARHVAGVRDGKRPTD